jgi:transcriptional regulator with XRE-family HTH domain
MLSQRLKDALKDKGWTVRELQRRSGVPYDTVYNLVSGRRRDPHLSVLKKIARALGLSLDTLAADDDEDAQAA